MGNWLGHVGSGFFFLVWASWWVLQLSFNNIRQKYERDGRVGVPSAALRLFRRVPLEGIIICLCTTFGFIAENMYPYIRWKMFDEKGNFIEANVWQHCTIWLAFWIFGFVKILTGSCVKKLKQWIPVFRTFSFFIQGIVFLSHLQERDGFNKTLHILLIVAIFLCILFSAFEIWMPKDNFLPLMRMWATFVNGTWLIQIGCTLYPIRTARHQWNADDPATFKFFTMVFAWHCIGNVISVLTLYCVVVLLMKIAFGKRRGYAQLDNDDSDSEGQRSNTMYLERLHGHEEQNNWSDDTL